MKIIIPVTDNKKDKYLIAQGFHNTSYVCIYNTSDNTYQWMETKEISEKEGNLSLALKRKGIFTIISSNMQLMALGLFIESGLKVYKAKGSSVTENIALFNSNQLEPFVSRFAGNPGNCGGSCSSCNTSRCN
jgi:predicted Fe-Mo cluster-binding NifX family protein